MSAGPWLSKYNFLGFRSIEFKVIDVGPLFDMLDLGFAGILIIGRDYKVCVVSNSAYLTMTLCDDTGCRSEAVTTNDVRGRPYDRTLDYAGRDVEGI